MTPAPTPISTSAQAKVARAWRSPPRRRSSARVLQRGGFVIGFVVGLLIGLAIALGVALYVTKAPNPFMNKVPQRTNAQDAAEVERNRNWDPNAALAGKNPAHAASDASVGSPASGVVTGPLAAPNSSNGGALPPPSGLALPPPIIPSTTPRGASGVARSLPNGDSVTSTTPGTRSGTSSTTSTVPSGDAFTYLVQAGAFARSEDAEQQRAKLAMVGIEARVTEREQAGRTVYRVRVGPFDNRDDAEAAKGKLNDNGIDSALVRVQK